MGLPTGRAKPLRTVSELADELGVTEGLEKESDTRSQAPGAAACGFNGKQTRGKRLKAKWFNPSEVRFPVGKGAHADIYKNHKAKACASL